MGLVLCLQKLGLTLAFLSVHLGLSLDSDNFETFWWMFVDKAGLQYCGQILGRARPFPLRQRTQCRTHHQFCRDTAELRTHHRFSQQQSRDLLRSGHAVKRNHYPLWLHFMKCRNTTLSNPLPLHPNCARNSPRYVLCQSIMQPWLQNSTSVCLVAVESFFKAFSSKQN